MIKVILHPIKALAEMRKRRAQKRLTACLYAMTDVITAVQVEAIRATQGDAMAKTQAIMGAIIDGMASKLNIYGHLALPWVEAITANADIVKGVARLIVVDGGGRIDNLASRFEEAIQKNSGGVQ